MRKAIVVLVLVAVAAWIHLNSRVPVESGEGADRATREVEIDAQLGESRWPGEADAADSIASLIGGSLEKTYPPEKRPVRRDAHPKAHGCVRASFAVNAELPENLAQGAFVPGKAYAAWIRFSNGASDPARDDAKGDARGMAIKLMGVPGTKLLPEERDAGTQDFIMINHPVFFIDDPQQYLTLVKRGSSSNPVVRLTAPFALGLEGALIARTVASKKIENPLYTRFWSMVPYRLGDDAHKQAIKFSARPCVPHANDRIPSDAGPNYLREAMAKTLAAGEACFDFLVQPRQSAAMKVEDSKTEWMESAAPFIKVATITIPGQDFGSVAQDEFCENLSFTPWHALPEHRPLGGVNRVRRIVYEQVSMLRHAANRVPRKEPTGEEFPLGATRR
ncbi:MAG: catalase family protein [Vicinamibacteria bacterium]|nr:catalase family protein [Vicinamibacteria bacterium]